MTAEQAFSLIRTAATSSRTIGKLYVIRIDALEKLIIMFPDKSAQIRSFYNDESKREIVIEFKEFVIFLQYSLLERTYIIFIESK